MKYIFIIILSFFTFTQGYAQPHVDHALPAARRLNDSAMRVFTRANGNKQYNPQIARLFEAAIKLDSTYYQVLVNKMSFESHFDQFEKALKTALRMKRIFPKEPDVYYYCGLLQLKTKRKAEGMASFNKLLAIYNADLKDYKKQQYYKAIMINKGIVLIMLDRLAEGKNILLQVHNSEQDDVLKSYLAFYINSSKEEIIEDKLPGK
jgi:tetratricopeptide (TPR) repeat protein